MALIVFIWAIILPLVLCGYEYLSCTLREEHTLALCENRVWRCLNMREEVTGSWRNIHSQELIMCQPNTIRIIKSRQKKGQACSKRRRCRVHQFEIQKRSKHSKQMGIGRVTVQWILKNRVMGYWLDSCSLRQGLVVECCAYGGEPSKYTEGKKFPDTLSY